MDTIGVYCLYFDNSTDQVYIGKSIQIQERYKSHIRDLENNRHKNYKLQERYNKYGKPSLLILEICAVEDLCSKEKEYIKEFDSFNNGLNLTNGGDGGGYGEGVHLAKYSEQEYAKILDLLASTNLSIAKIAELTGTTINVVKKISAGATHGYLKELYPENYQKVEQKRYRDNSANTKGINYPMLVSPMGVLFTVSNIHAFCREHGLQPQNLHKVLTKQRPTHKGWRLKN